MSITHPHHCKYVLLGEDDIDDQDLLKEIFFSIDESLGFVPINNGKILIEYLNKLEDYHLPSVLILDYNMPELNGGEILGILKDQQRYLRIPKLIWSTSNSQDCKALCLQNGATEYIVKPTNIATLVEVAKHMLSFCHGN